MNKIVLVNDNLTGGMGEKVFWDFLLEGIPGIIGVDNRTTRDFAHYIQDVHADADIIIQNASFIGMVDESKPTVAFLQDNLRAMHRPSQLQEDVLRKATKIVSNSKLTASSYPEYDIKVIPIGVDAELFKPTNKISETPIGIFVGALNEVKGWEEVRLIIEKRKDISWIVVSKDNKQYHADNAVTYNRIDQKHLCSLLNQSDFFILGSSVETECLAAVEACMCEVPVVMHLTGIFADFDDDDRAAVGYFGNDLEAGIEIVMKSKHRCREVMMRHGLDSETMVARWRSFLKGIL